MRCHTLTLRAGQTGRLAFSITPEGDYALTGAVRSEGQDIPLEADGTDLLIPALPPGLHLIEARANGCTVMYGGLEVLPSPLADASGEVAWAVNADLAETIAAISVTLTEGPQGPQGEKGDQGEPGPQGEKGDQGEPGPAPTEAQVQQAVENALYQGAETTLSTPEGTGSSNAHYMELDAQHVPAGRLSSISIMARTSGANPSTYSYIGLWELGTDGTTWSYLGSSTNAPGQSRGTAAAWQFDGVILHGRRLRLLAQASPSGDFASSNALGLSVSPTPSGDTSQYTYNSTEYAYLPELTFRYSPLADVTISTQTASLAMENGSMGIGTDVSQYRYPIFYNEDGSRNDYNPVTNPGGSVFTLYDYFAAGYDIFPSATLSHILSAATPYIHKPASIDQLQIQASANSVWKHGRMLVIDLSLVAADLGTGLCIADLFGSSLPEGPLSMPVLFYYPGAGTEAKLYGGPGFDVSGGEVRLMAGLAGLLTLYKGNVWLHISEQFH